MELFLYKCTRPMQMKSFQYKVLKIVETISFVFGAI